MSRALRHLGAGLLVAMLASGCAPVSAVSRAEIEYSRADFRNKFIEDRARCFARGGRIVIVGWGGSIDRDGIPRNRVRYTCS